MFKNNWNWEYISLNFYQITIFHGFPMTNILRAQNISLLSLNKKLFYSCIYKKILVEKSIEKRLISYKFYIAHVFLSLSTINF